MAASAPDPRRGANGPGRGRLAAALDWTFRDRRTGRITIAQAPNPSLLLGVGCAVAARATEAAGGPPGAVAALRVTAGAALAWWGLREVAQGVNPWRRVLGAAALAGLALHLRDP